MKPVKFLFPLITLALFVSVLALWPGLKQAWFDLSTLESRQQVQNWLSNPQKPIDIGEWIKTRENLQYASAACPQVAQYHIELARLEVLRGLKAHHSKLVRDVFYQEAVNQYRAALQVQPNNASSMANIVQFKSYLGQYDAEFERLFIRSRQLNPYEPDTQLALLNAGFQSWTQLTEPMRAQVRQVWRLASAQQKDNVQKLKANYPKVDV